MSEPLQRVIPESRTPAIVGAALAVLAIVTFTDALRLTAATGPGVGPSAAMKMIGLMLAVLAIAHLAQAWKKRGQAAPAPSGERVNPVALAWVLAGLVGQIVALNAGAGFILSSTWLFIATAKGFGRSFRSAGPVIGLALSLAVYAFFTLALSLSLPAGPLERLLFG